MLRKEDWKVHKDREVNLNRSVPHGEAVSTRRRRSVGRRGGMQDRRNRGAQLGQKHHNASFHSK